MKKLALITLISTGLAATQQAPEPKRSSPVMWSVKKLTVGAACILVVDALSDSPEFQSLAKVVGLGVAAKMAAPTVTRQIKAKL